MAYRDDPDLVFLGDMKENSSLSDLVSILTKDKDGSTRLTEELTSSDVYKKYYPAHKKYWKEIAAEVQLFGANSIASMFRLGKGVLYREILIDVAKHLNAKVDEKKSTVDIEQELTLAVFKKALEKMTPEELKKLGEDAGISNLGSITAATLTASFQTIFKLGGFQSYRYTLMIVNQVTKAVLGRGLTFAGNAALMRTASIFTGPIGWAITGAWTAVDIASPATRVTVPAVFEIIRLRQQYQLERQNLWDKIQQEMNAN